MVADERDQGPIAESQLVEHRDVSMPQRDDEWSAGRRQRAIDMTGPSHDQHIGRPDCAQKPLRRMRRHKSLESLRRCHVRGLVDDGHRALSGGRLLAAKQTAHSRRSGYHWHRPNPCVGISVLGIGRADACITGMADVILHAHHRDTPPEDVLSSRQVSWLAGRRRCPVFPRPNGPSDVSWTSTRRLQLRGQPRHERCRRGTGFPLSFRPETGRTTTVTSNSLALATSMAVMALMALIAFALRPVPTPPAAPAAAQGAGSGSL
jgi:hypothetical protein